MARHRLPLALGGLLVPLPTALTAATVSRATDGADLAIHQLANEVTKIMFSKPKWVALVAVGALTVVGGLLLAAGGGDLPAPRPTTLSHTGPRRCHPNREWMVKFRNPTKEQEAADRDPKKVLAVVTAQTGLTFKKEMRKVTVLYVSVPEKK